jgi:uncharacterized protein YjbJ (UPF0337 family)
LDFFRNNARSGGDEALNDPELEAEGRSERAAGKVREGFGKAKRKKVGEAVDDVADKIDQ